MRIPVSNNFGVAPTISPGADFKAPQASTVAADQLQQAGKAVQQGADAYARIQNDMLQDANRLRLDAAGTEAQRVMLARMNEVKALKGESAIYRGNKPLDDEYDEALTKDFEAIGAKLGNDAQRQAWALESGAMRRQFRSQVSSHLAAEYQNYDKQVQVGIIETSYQLMSQNIDKPDEITRGRDAIVGAVARLNKGAPPKFVTAETIKALTPAHASIVQSLLAGGAAQQARDYFARPDVQAEMLPAVRARLSESLAVASADIMAEQAVQEVIGGMGDGWTRAEADRQLSSRFASDPATLKTARNLLNYQDGLRDDARKEYTRRLTEPVERLLGDADRSGGLISTGAPELVALRGRDAEAYRTYSDRVAAHNEQVRSSRRAAEDRARAAHERAMRDGAKGDAASTAVWYGLKTDPSALKAANLIELRRKGLLGEKHFNDLVGDQQGMIKGDLNDRNILDDKAAVDMVLKGAKIETTSKEADPQKLGAFYERFNQRVREAGRKLTQPEKIDVARELLAEVVVEKGLFFDNKKPAFEVVVPPGDRAQIIASLRRAGKPVTEANIANLYLTGKQK